MRATEDVETMETMGGLSLVIGVVTMEEDFQTVELIPDIRGMITWEAMIVGAQTRGGGIAVNETAKTVAPWLSVTCLINHSLEVDH